MNNFFQCKNFEILISDSYFYNNSLILGTQLKLEIPTFVILDPLILRGDPLISGGYPLVSGGFPLKLGGLKLQKLGFPVSIMSPKLKNCYRNKNLKSEFQSSYMEKSYSWLIDFPLKLRGIPLKLRGVPLKSRVMPSLKLGVVYPPILGGIP